MYFSIVGRISQSALPSFLMASDVIKRFRESLVKNNYGGEIHGLALTIDSFDPESNLTSMPRKAKKQRNPMVRDANGVMITLQNLYIAGIVVDERRLSACKAEREVVRLLLDSISKQAEAVLGNLKGFDIDAFLRDLEFLAG